MRTIASIALSNTTREFDREYSYLVPDALLGSVRPGVRVIVPFGKGNRPREGYVLGLGDASAFKNLKEIDRALDPSPVLNERMLRLAAWMRKRYICTYSDAFRCILPAGIGTECIRMVKLKKRDTALKGNAAKIAELLEEAGGECSYESLRSASGIEGLSSYLKELEGDGIITVIDCFESRVKQKKLRVAGLAIPVEEALELIEGGRLKKIQQIRVLEILLENEYIAVPDLTRFAGVSPAVLNTLKKYGYIYFKEIEVNRDPLKSRQYERTEPLRPTAQQARALEKLEVFIEEGGFHEALLHGVTGSGKTEVYLQLMKRVLDKGQQALMLVPEIALTPQAVERLMSRFGEDVAVLHSRLSLGERFDQWRLIKDGRKRIVVGARSAVFAPLDRPGLIIIDEEHESSYKSETTPRYHAADVARERCSMEGALLLYGSATPAVDTYFRALGGKIALIELDERANKLPLPEVELVDMRLELAEGNKAMFSGSLVQKLEDNLQRKGQTILFLNRRGYSSFVMCRSCGLVLKCTSCSLPMTYHHNGGRLICHYCGFTIKEPSTCPKCGSPNIRQFGTGTQKVEEELKKRFRDCSVLRMDLDTTGYKNSHEELLRRFRDEKVDIMVGTQMIAKGHDFPNVTLVGVLAADSLLNMGDYRASERTFQLLTQVAGRAGRGEAAGRVVIQSYNIEDYSINAACRQDYKSFFRQELSLRKKLEFPPFTNIGEVVLSGTDDKGAFIGAREMKKDLEKDLSLNRGDVKILGPARTPITKIRGKYRWRLILKCPDIDALVEVLSRVRDGFHRNKRSPQVELSMDINPMNML